MPTLLAEFAFGAPNTTTIPALGVSQNQRDTWEIIWSCVMTIFACTWIAIHPNIPATSDSDAIVFLRRAGLMLCGLIAPEVIILWAMKQWDSAREIGQRHREKGWTTTHGFFLQMGGFVLCLENESPRPLDIEEMEKLHSRGCIDWPKISESEIQDKSKGDAFSKGIVILQTSWFLVQCILRGAFGLAITELELLTLAFALLNIVTYAFWWKKPVDIRQPYPVASQYYITDVVIDDVSTNTSAIDYYPNASSRRALSFNATVSRYLLPILRPISPVVRFLAHLVYSVMGKTSTEGRVSTFHAAKISANRRTFLWMAAVCTILGCAFGGIHCIAWSFQFPSPVERRLWRISSVTITCSPFLIAPLSAAVGAVRFKINHDNFYRNWFLFPIMLPLHILLVLLVLAYTAARIVIFVEAFMALRRLPPQALQDMDWSHFIPHL